ncbi:hypothetical protein [Streptomyces avicenniae]|uniref:PH-like domain-containing protein n=1 Tax=Streptomyces avicenniae TaxID=500153 RepID=UPI000AE2F5FF|nr:hypothetical protein [Streptomyces avicenniae]
MNAPHALTALAAPLAEETRRSQEVTDWGERIAWLVGIALFVALVYWLMREGWKWRATLQGDLPELPPVPEDDATPRLTLTGRYHGSTTAGQWLDRIVARGLGARSRVRLDLTDAGVTVTGTGAGDFLIPAARLRGARLDKGIAGKVLTEGGLLVLTWEHGDRLLDSGFRSDTAAGHAAWVEALGTYLPEGVAAPASGPPTTPGPHSEEGAR